MHRCNRENKDEQIVFITVMNNIHFFFCYIYFWVLYNKDIYIIYKTVSLGEKSEMYVSSKQQ